MTEPSHTNAIYIYTWALGTRQFRPCRFEECWHQPSAWLVIHVHMAVTSIYGYLTKVFIVYFCNATDLTKHLLYGNNKGISRTIYTRTLLNYFRTSWWIQLQISYFLSQLELVTFQSRGERRYSFRRIQLQISYFLSQLGLVTFQSRGDRR